MRSTDKNNKSQGIENTEEMLLYKQQIVNALRNPGENRNRIFENDDRTNNAMIMSAMFDHCNRVVMYCGQMSVFREKFYKKIEEEISVECSSAAKAAVKHSLEQFLRNNSNKLTILLENYDESYLDDLISSYIGKDKENVTIRRVDKKKLLTGMLSHTAIGMRDASVIIRRRETNSSKYKARCMVNLESATAEDSKSLMNYIEEASFKI